MKKTMKYLSGCALVLMGILALGCQKIELQSSETNEKSGDFVTYTTSVSFADTPDTKSLTTEGTKTFGIGEQIAVVYSVNEGKGVTISKALTIADISNPDHKSAKFTFQLPSNVDKTQTLEYIYPASMANDNGTVNYDALNAQNGSWKTIEEALDLSTGTAGWNGNDLSAVSLKNELAICEFRIVKNVGSSDYDYTDLVSNMIVKNGGHTYSFVGPIIPENEYIYMAFRPGDGDYDFTIYCEGYCYKKTVTGKSLSANTINPIKLSLPERSHLVDLSEVPEMVLKVADGDILTGTLATKTKIVVDEANNPTVTLQNVNITNLSSDCGWAGINCLQNTTLKIEGENIVTGGVKDGANYPGIHVVSGATLTITGEHEATQSGHVYKGKLTASGNMDSESTGAAGIGSANGKSCGNIIINGGHIIANGGVGSPGIGAGSGGGMSAGTCGDITITGTDARVEAHGGDYAAGIGSGLAFYGNSECGNISFTESCIVFAYGGKFAAGIGTGVGQKGTSNITTSSCGNILFAGNFTQIIVQRGEGDDLKWDVGRGRSMDDGQTTIGTITKTIGEYGYIDYKFENNVHTPASIDDGN